MKYIQITNLSHPDVKPILAKYCRSFFCQLRGLMFTASLPPQAGLLLVQGSDSRVDASIHMMFMRMDLSVVWMDHDLVVVDAILARRWKFMYVPQKPARYVLEMDASHLKDFNIGDAVSFSEQLA